MEERRIRLGPLVEWLLAAAGVVLLAWVILVPVQRALGPDVEASRAVEPPPALPPGVPSGATAVPVMLLGRDLEIRQGDLRSRVDALLPERWATGEQLTSKTEFGDRHTRAYNIDGTEFFIVCERAEAAGPMRVAGIYLK